MPVVQCPHCEHNTGDVANEVGAILLKDHLDRSHPVAPVPKAPALRQPEIKAGVSSEEWDAFRCQWDLYLKSSNINAANAPVYALSCCDFALTASVQKMHPKITEKPIGDVLELI